ncbi:MAG: DNA-binding response regulator [Rhizobiaceae bacterium MnEN-MB40S]|nr:MAG: DNA-binding response regulator [Rhizobiaceae bacterium MnEN-MB40S]
MSDMAPHILVVDDHRDIRESLARYLTRSGMRASTADSAAQARKVMKAAAIDLVVLDIMMPGEDGLSLCRHLVESDATPVILLTAMAEDTDRVVGLEIGADDYVTKPFNPRELLARIKAVLRRASLAPKERDPVSSEKLGFGDWVLDMAQRHLIGEDDVITPLSTGEFQLLVAFLKRPRMVLSRDQLLDLTTGRAANMFDRSIDNQVSRLRRKIEKDPKNPVLIKTVWGGGYSFTADVAEPDG